MIIPEKMREYRLIPLRTNTKIAAVPWKNDTRYNMDDYPQATGYGIDTGRSGLIVIDCDIKQDTNGVDNYLDIALQETGQMPSTFTVQSASGGLHFYYEAPANSTTRNSTSQLAPGVDVRAIGGYIVGPGSIITQEDGTPGEYVIDNPAPIEPLPTWLLDRLGDKKAAAPVKDSTSTPKQINSKQSGERTEKMNSERVVALSWGLSRMNSVTAGERQSTLNTVSYFMGRKRVPEDRAKEVVEIAIAAGLPLDEAERAFSRGYEEGLNEEELTFEQVVTSYNARTGNSSMNDPMDTGYYTHHNLAQNFHRAFPDRFIYWEPMSAWYAKVDEEHRWCCISAKEMHMHMDKYLDNLVTEIRTKNPKITSSILRQQEKLWNKSFIEGVTGAAEWAFMSTNENLFDSQRNLLNCKNGVIDLRKGTVLPHDKERYMTHYVDIEYKPEATDEQCNQVLESIPEESRDFLQLFAGQSLTGHQPSSQVAIFLHGRGSNGKSTFIDLLLKTSGDYGRLQAPSILLSDKQGGDKFALADIEGLRLAVVEELPNAKVLDTGALKRLVGTRFITSRRLYENNRTFPVQATLFVTCNRLPMINETAEGAWRRVLVVTFPYSYKKTTAQIKGENDRLGSPRVLYAAQNSEKTAEAFLAWRIKGAMRWFEDPEAEMKVPEEIARVTEEWNENNDIMLSWFNNNIDAKPDSFITIEDLRASYNEWAVSHGNSTVSMRFFVESFLNHSTFSDNRLVYKKAARIREAYTQSKFTPTTGSDYAPRPLGERTSFVLNAEFKK